MRVHDVGPSGGEVSNGSHFYRGLVLKHPGCETVLLLLKQTLTSEPSDSRHTGQVVVDNAATRETVEVVGDVGKLHFTRKCYAMFGQSCSNYYQIQIHGVLTRLAHYDLIDHDAPHLLSDQFQVPVDRTRALEVAAYHKSDHEAIDVRAVSAVPV